MARCSSKRRRSYPLVGPGRRAKPRDDPHGIAQAAALPPLAIARALLTLVAQRACPGRSPMAHTHLLFGSIPCFFRSILKR